MVTGPPITDGVRARLATAYSLGIDLMRSLHRAVRVEYPDDVNDRAHAKIVASMSMAGAVLGLELAAMKAKGLTAQDVNLTFGFGMREFMKTLIDAHPTALDDVRAGGGAAAILQAHAPLVVPPGGPS